MENDDEKPYSNISTAFGAQIAVIKQLTIYSAIKKLKPKMITNLINNKYPVPMNRSYKSELNSSTSTECESENYIGSVIDNEIKPSIVNYNIPVIKQEKLPLYNKSKWSSSNFFKKEQYESIFFNGKDQLLHQKLNIFKSGFKKHFSEPEYREFSAIARLMLDMVMFYSEDFKKKSVASIIYSI